MISCFHYIFLCSLNFNNIIGIRKALCLCIMDITTGILDLLIKIEKSQKCLICVKKFDNPVRIKTCGHYFCEECLKSFKSDHNCPKCNEFYEVKDLEKKNIAKECQDSLFQLRMILENIQNKTLVAKQHKVPTKDKHSEIKVPCHSNKTVQITLDNIFFHDHKKYHVNFVNTISKTNAKGETPLHLACKRRKLIEVKNLVEKKVDINVKDYAGWAPLHEAIQSQSVEIAQYLLQKGCLINIPGAEYVTPLHQAVSLENIDMVKILLEHGADKDMVDYTGLKPLDSTKNETVKELLRSFTKHQNNETVFELYLSSKLTVYCHTIDEEQKKKLEDCNNITVVEKMEAKNTNLTHFVIKKTHGLSYKVLQAMLLGLQFFTQESIGDYIAKKYFINIPEYVFSTNNTKLNIGIRKSMISTLLKLPKLFDGINFYIEDHNSAVEIYKLKVDKVFVTRLIYAGGGRVLHRPPATRTCESEYAHPFFAPEHSGTYRCCNFIIYAENNPPELLYNMNELQHKSSRWLIDCIESYEILN